MLLEKKRMLAALRYAKQPSYRGPLFATQPTTNGESFNERGKGACKAWNKSWRTSDTFVACASVNCKTVALGACKIKGKVQEECPFNALSKIVCSVYE